MCSRSKPKPRCSGSNMHKVLQESEADQKTGTVALNHPGPNVLNQDRLHKEKSRSLCRTSQSGEETPVPLAKLTKSRASVQKREIKKPPSEFSSGTVLLENGVLRSVKDQTTEHSSHRGQDVCLGHWPSKSVLAPPRGPFSQHKPCSSSDPGRKQQVCTNRSDQKDVNEDGRLKPKFIKKAETNRQLWGGIKVAEVHERKLQTKLEKLSAQSCPSRDRLVVFSDVFDDVCEGSPVFGRILREIKTEYDLYVNHLMSAHLSELEVSPDAAAKDPEDAQVCKMLEDAEKEVHMLEQEARRALEENRRARDELQNVPAIMVQGYSSMQSASLSGLKDREAAVGCKDSVQAKRVQVFDTWSEIQQLEEEIEKKMVSADATKATEKRIRDVKTEIIRLIASTDRLKTTNKVLEKKIDSVLKREKASTAMKRLLWDKIYCDLQIESE